MKYRKKTKKDNQEKLKKTKTKTPRFALAVRQKIVGYYQTGYFTANMLCKKYGISVDLLLKWLRESETIKGKELEKYSPQVEKKHYKDKDEEIEALKKALKEKDKELKYAELKHKAMDILIDIAEEKLGITIKKKSGKWQ
jgi:3-hydroxyisobutyrate dehydrogenase-like beta-hydroxyacid dehydrogenase